jgi:UDP-glucose 4-epimerase
VANGIAVSFLIFVDYDPSVAGQAIAVARRGDEWIMARHNFIGFQMVRILVTGGASYVGSHACKALAAAGYEPVVFDNLCAGHDWAVKWGPFEKGDLLDRDRIDGVVQKYQPAGVIHFASFAYVGESVTDPAEYWRNNVVGAINLCDALAAADASAMVFSSSCTVYGLTTAEFISEAEPVPAIDDARRAGDPARLVADIAHARKNLAWQPVHSSLDNIVSTAWNWHRSSVSADRA